VTTALPYYAKDFGVDALTLGYLIASWAGAQFLCAPLWGRLSDRIGRRPVMLITIAGTSVALAMLGLAENLWQLFATRVLAGGFAANISVASAYIADVTDEDERTRWMGVLGMSFGVGFLLGPALGGVLGPYGYAVPMLAAASLAALNLVFAAFLLQEPPGRDSSQQPTAGAAPRARQTRADVLRDPAIRRMCIANLGFSLAVTQLETMFAFLMIDRFDYDLHQVAGILVAMALVMGAIQGGGMKHLAARYPERSLISVGALMMAASFVWIPYAPTVSLLLIPLFVSAVGRAILQAPLMGLISMQANSSNRGVVMGAFQSAAAFGRIGGPIAAGWLYQSGQPRPFLLASVLLLFVAFLAPAMPGREPAVPAGAEPTTHSS
jgi:multidrug resistance protein